MKYLPLFLLIYLISSACPSFAQERESAAEPKGLRIDGEMFDNTMLDPDMFRAMLADSIFEDIEKLEKVIFQAIDYAVYANAKSRYHHEALAVGDSVSLELDDGLFLVRILSPDAMEKIQDMDISELPKDLKSKQMFRVTKIAHECVIVERATTKLAIPVDRILYFQRGLAPFFR